MTPTKRSSKFIGIAVVCLLGGLIAAYVIATREAGAPAPGNEPQVEAIPNIEELKAKAESGNAEARKGLGAAYAKGLGVKRSYAEAAKWYRQAADQGHAGAQAALAELYEAGQGVPFDPAEAAKWFRRAAEQGHAVAQYSLAVLYVAGKGVPRDIDEALKWYRQAADQGDASAQYILGVRHSEGDGLPRDLAEAYKWLALAAAQKDPEAAKARDELKRRMTREQTAEGQRRADAFAAKEPAPSR
jgi:hypothetical protein